MAVQTFQTLFERPLVTGAFDRREPIDKLVDEALARWRQDMYKKFKQRHPSPAYTTRQDGVRIYQGTDFDLLTLAVLLSYRNKVINIPTYENVSETSRQSNRRVIAHENRHGQLLRLVSNKKSHAFSVMIMDFNVGEERHGFERVGAPRNFMMVNDSGELYRGWSSLDWNESQEEREFIERNGLQAFRDVIQFRYAVPPALAGAFGSTADIERRIIESRREDEFAHYKALANELKNEVRLPRPLYDEVVVHWKEGPKESKKVKALEAKVIIPPFRGEYPYYGIEEFTIGKKPRVKRYTGRPTTLRAKQEVLRFCLWHVEKLTYTYGPMIRAPIRAVDLAFFLYGFTTPEKTPGSEIHQGWTAPLWEKGYREPKKRIIWNRRVVNDDAQLLYRIREVTMQRRAEGVSLPYALNKSG